MDYFQKLTTDRYRPSTKEGRGIEDEYESNRGRIMHSAAFRRLQKKAQVFSFETNAAVRSRMTHSIEVMQAGRYIARNIVAAIIKKDPNKYTFEFRSAFISAVEMSCLLHDIGNPPFGHFGEAAINEWMKKNLQRLFQLADKEFSGDLGLQGKLFDDLKSFEGNAQGLNLTYSQVASVLKYTRSAYENVKDIDPKYNYLAKKPGYYFSEDKLIKSLKSNLGMQDYCRHPLAYIMEAADDISYCVSDLEDAVEKGIVDFSAIQKNLIESFDEGTPEEELISKLLDISKNVSPHERSILFRVKLADNFVPAVVSCYLTNEQSIFNGDFNRPLLDEETTVEGRI